MNTEAQKWLEELKPRVTIGLSSREVEELISRLEAEAAEVRRWEEEARTWRSPQQILRLDAEARVKQFDLALQSLTPGGSEFVNDPERCVGFVRQARDGEMQALKAAAKRAQVAEARVEALEAELKLVIAPQPEREKAYRTRIATLEAENRRLRDAASQLAQSIDAELCASPGLSSDYPHLYNMLHTWHEDACAALAPPENPAQGWDDNELPSIEDVIGIMKEEQPQDGAGEGRS